MKMGKRCPDNLFSPIPFLHPLPLWDKRAANFQVPWPYVPHTSLPTPTLRLFCTCPTRNTSLTAWMLNDFYFSFICSTPYYLLLQDTIHFCPTPSDLSTSQTLTQIPHPRTFLTPSRPQVHLLHLSSTATLRAPGFLISLETGSSTTHLPSPPCPQLLIHCFSFSSCRGKNWGCGFLAGYLPFMG